MPRYYFHIHDGSDFPDTEGTELADLTAARDEAVRISGAVIRELGPSFWEHAMGEWRLEVVDESGRVILRLRFSGERVN